MVPREGLSCQQPLYPTAKEEPDYESWMAHRSVCASSGVFWLSRSCGNVTNLCPSKSQCLCQHPSALPFPPHSCPSFLARVTPATLSLLLFLENSTCSPVSEPSLLLFLLPGTHFLQIAPWLISLLQPVLSSQMCPAQRELL